MEIKYQFWATLLDAFTGYINAGAIWEEYWGGSDNPSKTYDEFRDEQEQSLLDTINKVPFVSKAASQGTAFNELVDSLLGTLQQDDRKSKEITAFSPFKSRYPEAYDVAIDDFVFRFPGDVARTVAGWYKNAQSQVYTDGILPTCYGDVRLYGYIDELLPLSCHDIKTTGKYRFGKFKNHWQHIVYPYCLQQHGCEVGMFSYDVIVINDYKGKQTYELKPGECYYWDTERDLPRLRQHCEMLIEWIETHRDKITNRKLFNLI